MHHEVKKTLKLQKDCPTETFLNPSNLCLDTVFPEKTVWKFTIDWDSDKLTYQQPEVINEKSERPFTRKSPYYKEIFKN